MLALSKITSGPGGLSLVETEKPLPAQGEVLVKVLVAGVCGTDMQIYRGQAGYARRMHLPTVLGHEMVGVIEALGPGLQDAPLKLGDVVSLESHLPCWKCEACLTGRSHVCAETRYPGVDFNGAFAEYIVVPASILWVNPSNVAIERAALLEPLGIAVHAALEGYGVEGKTVAINGCGPIGLLNIAVARHLGASLVIAIEPNSLRRAAAKVLKADFVIDPSSTDVVAEVRRLTHDLGADVVFEYSGHPTGVSNTFAMVGQLGQVRWCATPDGTVDFNFSSWKRARPTIFNIHGRKIWETWHKAAELIADPSFDFTPVISHRFPLNQAPEAFRLLDEGLAIKALIYS